ncbi:unnamed protein product [Urochloa humidicola]
MGTGARLSSHSHSPLALRPGSSVQPRVSTMLLWRRQRRQINREQPMANRPNCFFSDWKCQDHSNKKIRWMQYCSRHSSVSFHLALLPD